MIPDHDRVLHDLNERFEPFRQAALAQRSKRRGMTVIAVPIAFLIGAVIVLAADLDRAFLFLPLGLAATGWAWAARPVSAYRRRVKAEAFPTFLKAFGEDFRFDPGGAIPMTELKPSGLIPSHDKTRFEDYITGTWQGLSVELVEGTLIDVRGSGKDRRDVPVFDGLFVRFGMHKRFSGRTVVRADRGLMNVLGGLGSGLERVRLEDSDFEKAFEVYASDQVEARYLLTLTFMQRLLGLAAQEGRGGKGRLQISFYDDRLLIMLPCGRNRFEVTGVERPGHLGADLDNLIRDMEQIFAVAETLRLNQDTRL